MKEANTQQVVGFRQDIRKLLERRLLETVELVLEEELSQALGAGRYERGQARRGHRNGSETRRLTTVHGPRDLAVPRGRVKQVDGTTGEFHSVLLPRYARRTREIDEAILGCYLAGGNSRRIKKALSPLLGDENLSKSAVSRVVVRLKESFATWSSRDLSSDSYPVLFLDGFCLKVRLVRRVVSVPILAILGVGKDGTKCLLSLAVATSESTANWGASILDLQRRGLATPSLLVVDGHQGLGKALDEWPGVKVQRCTVHKLRNLEEACPAHARAELRRDYRDITHAENGLSARHAHAAFARKWSKLCPAVARSLGEAGDELLTFYEFPEAMWRSLRTTNVLENLNREFRRRTKTQASFATESSAVTLLYGLVAMGQIEMRKINGHEHVRALVDAKGRQAA